MITNILHLFVLNIAAVILYMTAWYVAARLRKRLDVVDIAWGGGFILVAYGCFLRNSNAYTLALALMVAAWGLRLMLHIASRNRGKQNDPRYDALSDKWSPKYFWLRAYASIFLIQGLLNALISLPVAVNGAAYSHHGLVSPVVGTIMWAIGFCIEAVADRQLSKFIRHKTADKPVMDTGLWRYSRHPNYFGEVLVWWGIGVFALSSPFGWVGLLGPLTITGLILFISGIPPLEKRKQNDPAYQAYAAHTSKFFPLPPKS